MFLYKVRFLNSPKRSFGKPIIYIEKLVNTGNRKIRLFSATVLEQLYYDPKYQTDRMRLFRWT